MGGKLFLRLAGRLVPWLAFVCLGVSAWAVNVPPKNALTMEGQQVTVNDDDANGNEDWDKNDGGPIPNGRPLLREFSIHAKGIPGGGVLTIDDSDLKGHAELWQDELKETPMPLSHKVPPHGLDLPGWVEGIESTQKIDSLELKATYVPNSPKINGQAVASFKFGVFQVDLDVDSNNDSGLSAAGYTHAEDKIENSPNKPGKAIFETNGDVDDDDIPDFADGCGIAGGKVSGLKLVPMRVELKAPIDPAKAKVKFTYNASIPRLGQGIGESSGPDGAISYKVIKSGLRLWKVDGDKRKSGQDVDAGGDFIPSNKELSWKDVASGSTGREVTLYLEYVEVEGGGALSSKESTKMAPWRF